MSETCWYQISVIANLKTIKYLPYFEEVKW